MKRTAVPFLVSVILGLSFCLPTPGQDEGGNVEPLFRDPPDAARPGVWWHWMGCNVSREGITRDLVALKEAGFGGATIFGLSDTCTPWPCPISNSPSSGLVAYADPWWNLVAKRPRRPGGSAWTWASTTARVTRTAADR